MRTARTLSPVVCTWRSNFRGSAISVALRATFLGLWGWGLLAAGVPATADAQVSPLSLNDYSRLGNRQTAAHKVNDAIFMALGFSNTFLVRTDDGNVIIDTSSPVTAKKHYELLRKVSDAPVRYVILTHGHHDHTGGLRYWMEPNTKLVVQLNYLDFDRYQERLRSYFNRTGAAQFGLDPGQINAFDRVPQKHFRGRRSPSTTSTNSCWAAPSSS